MENFQNLMPAFTLFGNAILFGLALLTLFIVLVIADLSESGTTATISVLIFLGLNYFWGNFDVLTIISIRNVGVYLFLGFLFSLIRTYFKGKELSVEQKKYFDLKDHVFRWWFLFPICLINWVFGSLLKDMFDAIYMKIGKVYSNLFGV